MNTPVVNLPRTLHVPPHTIMQEAVYLHDSHVCVIADEYAQVNIIFDQSVVHDAVIHLYAHKNASITYFTASTTSNTQHIELHMLGRGANITVHGIYGITDAQRCTITTKQEHTVPGATSTVLIKGIVGGQAVAEYIGTITIAEHASQSNANQQAATLLVSPQARAKSIPSLQVLTNDVRCKHGSAVGQLNKDQLFYAQARGLSKEQAQRMLLHGFLAQATIHLPLAYASAIIERIVSIF